MALTQVDQGLLGTYAQYTGFKNRIINGAMMIDQRNAGASVTPTTDNTYTLDRWAARLSVASKFSVQQDTTVPSGYKNSLKVTSAAATSVGSTDFYAIMQAIEGFNTADLGWGAVGASSVTLSFWVRSSLTGTFGGTLTNASGNRAYPYTYTISNANTWEQKSVTITGDTSGTWATNNTGGVYVFFGLGVGSSLSGTAGSWGNGYLSATGAQSVVGTNGATFYITGVQLEKGSTATSFDYRPYGSELALCQRYYWKGYTNASGVYGGSGGSVPIVSWSFPVTMRSSPTWSWISGGTSGNGNGSYALTGSYTTGAVSTDSIQMLFTQTGATGSNTQGCTIINSISSFAAEL